MRKMPLEIWVWDPVKDLDKTYTKMLESFDKLLARAISAGVFDEEGAKKMYNHLKKGMEAEIGGELPYHSERFE